MSLDGIILNGTICLDGNPELPEGVRVRVEFEDEARSATESRDDYLAGLRESIEEARTGQTRPAREVLRELALKHGLTPYGASFGSRSLIPRRCLN